MDWQKKPPFGFRTQEELLAEYTRAADEAFGFFELKPNISPTRITECFIAWRYDLEKSVDRFKPEKKSSPDHVKCAGYLMYWLRRNMPIWQVEDTFEQYATEHERASLTARIAFLPENSPLPPNSQEITSLDELGEAEQIAKEFAESHDGIDIISYRNHRNRLKSYANEYIAFDFCYRLAKAYEGQKQQENGVKKEFRDLSEPFIDDFCYFLKYKSVSPHSLAFILRTAIQE